MPIRNPFARRPGSALEHGSDENARFGSSNPNAPTPGFEKVDTTASKSSSALSINSGRSQEPAEYKLSVVNDSGVYLPPSPPEKKGFWPSRPSKQNGVTKPQNSLAEIEAFSISRESFDSYRRSFDISAKSPVLNNEPNFGRQSLDSARMPRLPRSAIGERRFEQQPPTAEEGFEDVGLNDEQVKPQPRRRGFFSKFGEAPDSAQESSVAAPASKFHFMGRKRGQSGQGAELGDIERPKSAVQKDISED